MPNPLFHVLLKWKDMLEDESYKCMCDLKAFHPPLSSHSLNLFHPLSLFPPFFLGGLPPSILPSPSPLLPSPERGRVSDVPVHGRGRRWCGGRQGGRLKSS